MADSDLKSCPNLESIRRQRIPSGICLSAIVLIGLFLRLYKIGSESLWLDEGFSVLAANRPLGQVWSFIRGVDLHPPLYYMILQVWIGWFGNSETAMRVLSAIFGTLTIPLVYRLGRDWFDRPTALLAALLSAICLYLVFFGQEVRGYSLFAFLALMSMIFWTGLFQQPEWGTVVGYIICTTLTLYSHPYGVFHVAVQNIMFLALWLRERPLRFGWPGWIGLQVSLGLAFSPWLWVTLHNIQRAGRDAAAMLIPAFWDIPGALKAFAGDADFIANWSGERFWLGGLFVLLMLAGLMPTRWFAWRRSENSGDPKDDNSPIRRQGIFLAMTWLVCTIMIPYLVSILSVPVYSNRYMISGSFAFLLLVARGIRILPWQAVAWGLGILVILTQGLILVPYYSQVNKEAWKHAVPYVESRVQPGDMILFHAPYCRTAVYWYYAKKQNVVYQGFPCKSDVRIVTPEVIRDQLPPLLESRDRVCLILSHSFDKDGLIRKALDQSFVCTESKEFYRVSVWFYQRSTGAPPSKSPDPSPTESAKP